MNDAPHETPLEPLVTMGVNDAGQCLEGWSPVEDFGAGAGAVRCVFEGKEARVRLRVPEQASHVGLEVWAPRLPDAPRVACEIKLADPEIGEWPHLGPWATFEFGADVWRRIECPLVPGALLAGERVELRLRLVRPGAPPAQDAGGLPPRAAVRRVWMRGNRVNPGDATIVVLNWNGAEQTIECLESLQRGALEGARVLVVDNGSRDGSVDRIRARFPDQPILALPENRGYAGGNNAGIRAALDAGAKAVLLLNNDTQVEPGFLQALVWVMNSHLDVAAVSSSVRRMDRPETIDVAYLDIYFGHGLVHRRGVNALPGEGFDLKRQVEVAIGCSLLLSADALRTVGLLNEDYFAYHEEVDWCFRARGMGLEVHYQPWSRVWHGGSKSTDALNQPLGVARARHGRPALPNAVPLSWNPVRTYLGARNAVRFVKLHGTREQKRYFVRSTLYAVPLELLAVVMDHEEDLMLGLWTYGTAAGFFCFGPPGRRPAPIRYALGLLRLPIRLLWSLPRDLWRAHRDGRTAQVIEYCRGLWDGLLDRPLPLERLKLR